MSCSLSKLLVATTVSWTDAFDGGKAGIRGAGFDRLHVRLAFIDDIYECRLSIVLDGVAGNQGDAVHVLSRSPRVYELIREQSVVGVFESRAELDRTGGGIDLVVDCRQFAGRELGQQSAIVCIDRKGGAAYALARALRARLSSAMVKTTVIG